MAAEELHSRLLLVFGSCPIATLRHQRAVPISELSDEEQPTTVFLKRYFERAGMPKALWILNDSENVLDVRAILDCYR